MKRSCATALAALIVLSTAGVAPAFGQATFKIPFKFEAAGKKLPAGDYLVARGEDGQVILRQAAKGVDVSIPSKERLAPPDPPPAEPRLVFDAVGNFEPSYTEYMTEYRLAEVWLPGQDGFEVSLLKGAHGHQIVKGQIAKK